ncbi:MAG: PQQ-binding-like beta-propeller repeat protein [Pyrinomonadaceae bacterium]
MFGKMQQGSVITLLIFIIALVLTPFGFAGKASGEVSGQQIALSQPLTIRWQYDSDRTVNLTPATDGERIYLPLAEGTLVSLRATDGQLFWRTEIGGELSASPVADERAVYIASKPGGETTDKGPRALGALRALGREAGVTLWMRTFHFPMQGALAVNETSLFGAGSDGRVYALDKRTGRFLWVTQHFSPFASRPVISGSRLYIGNDDGTLFSLDPATGKQLWRYRTRGAVRGRVAVVEGVVYFGSADGFVYALDETDGRLRWRARTGAGVQGVANVPGGLIVASLDNFVYLLSLNRGDRLWKRQLAGRLAAEPLTAPDGALFTPLSGDTGIVLDLRDGKQLNSLPIGEDNSTTASPIIAGSILFVTTRHGLLAFSRPVDTSQSKTR